MNKYVMICRLRGPAYILLTGVIAILAEWTSIGWGKTWPLYIVLEGALQLAQRWALSHNLPPLSYAPLGDPYAAMPGTAAYPDASQAGGLTEVHPAAGESSHPEPPPTSEWRS